MAEAVLLILSGALLTSGQHNHSGNESYYEFPKFWTNTGFCPSGKIEHNEISASLLSEANRLNLRYIAGTGVTHVRVHWLLELIEFVQYTQSGVPIYDFTKLDAFLQYLDELHLKPVIEFMGNPGNVFTANPNNNEFLWMDFSLKVVKRYLNMFGAKKVLSWRFETWNEPDLLTYNKLNFTIEDYFIYVDAIRRGLKAAGIRPVNSLKFQLRGPAGLFKAESHHPLCWHILEKCHQNIKQCPFDVITYHRKGNGVNVSSLMDGSIEMLQDIYQKYPALQNLPISNDEADPIAGWATPRDFQQDVHYAAALLTIVLFHWQAKLERGGKLKQLESISHDNAFLSYHPHEFKQRTLLAHFRMNNTEPPHSQFIQKPVYAALALINKMAPLAAPLESYELLNSWLLKTTVTDNEPLYNCWLLLPKEIAYASSSTEELFFQSRLPYELCKSESYAFIIEVLVQNETDPAHIWRMAGSPAYPDVHLRDLMRRRQTPMLHSTGPLEEPLIHVNLGKIDTLWILQLRVCSNLVNTLKQPQELAVKYIFYNEVLLTWHEIINSTYCLKSYEVWYRRNATLDWHWISQDWHLPFPNFQYAPLDGGLVDGFYKVRAVDIFDRYSTFSQTVEYLEI